jgi:hypothetical protein
MSKPNPPRQFTTTQAAEAVGMVPITLQSWLKKGWLDHILGPREYRTTGKRTHFTLKMLSVLQVAKAFTHVLHPYLAIQAAAICQPGILLYLSEGRERFRFAGVALLLAGENLMSCPKSLATAGDFERHDWSQEVWVCQKPDGSFETVGKIDDCRPNFFFLIDLASIELPQPKEPQA